jgi:hypothetical protein
VADAVASADAEVRDPEAVVMPCLPVPVTLALVAHPASKIAAAVPVRVAAFPVCFMARRRRGTAALLA